MVKISNRFLEAVRQFYESAKNELGDEFGADQALAMFDALDPNLRGELLLATFANTAADTILKFDQDTDPELARSINAIRALRAATGLGLRDAKSMTDEARNGFDVTLGEITPETRTQLYTTLSGSGWYIE